MKKTIALLLIVVTLLSLGAFNSSEFEVDGEFLAYEYGVHYNTPEVTWVTVTVEDGEIVAYNINARQGYSEDTTDPADSVADVFGWNDLTKKELLEDYGMAAVAGGLEWYEQAAALEAYWLENGVSIDDLDENGNIDVVTGVSITVDAIYDLALEAIDNAKAGKFTALGFSDDDLYSATMTVSKKGEVSDLLLDVLQGNPANGTFAWNAKTKQELQFDYGMKDSAYSSGFTYSNGTWVSTGNAATL
ncbi:MAG: hypothetical protein WCR19_05525, partial [Acholeplasmataceae bacterium]